MNKLISHLIINFLVISQSLAHVSSESENQTKNSHLENSHEHDFKDKTDMTVFGIGVNKSALDFIPTVHEVDREKMKRLRQKSVGETLSQEVGVSSSFFGPNSSRPIIRGLDGDRVKILENGTQIIDASAVSQDHEIVIDALNIDRIEIIRGPGALLYGSSALGGVVNTITKKIPLYLTDHFDANYEIRSSSNDQGLAQSVNFDYGIDKLQFHAEGTLRESENYKNSEGEKVINSDNETTSWSLGSSYFIDQGLVGGSYSYYDSTYGTVAEESVKINTEQKRSDFLYSQNLNSFFDKIRLKSTFTDYQHAEIEDGEIGTTFKNQGNETRLDLRHQKFESELANFEGQVGLQSLLFNFDAAGDERFLPTSKNNQIAAFLFEEFKFNSLTDYSFLLGARYEQAQVKASETLIDIDSNNIGESTVGGSGFNKNYDVGNLSFGVNYKINPDQAFVLNFSYTERAPNYQELLANGAHLATGTFERGDLNLQTEKAQSVELSFRQNQDQSRFIVTGFLQDYQNYIGLLPFDGGGYDPEGDPGNRDLPLFQFQNVKAEFIGAEIELSHKFLNLFSEDQLEIQFQYDTVQAKNKTSDEALARITPTRQMLTFIYSIQKAVFDLGIQHVQRQSKVAKGESVTPDYTFVQFGVLKPFIYEDFEFEAFSRVNNLFDQKGLQHTSFLKEIAPLPGRNFIIGLRMVY